MDKEEIQVKSFFGKWRKVDKEKAKALIKHILDTSVASSYKYIEERFLKGITIKELFEEKNNMCNLHKW